MGHPIETPEGRVKYLGEMFGLALEYGKQNPGDGAIYTMTLKGHTLVRGKGRKTFLALLDAWQSGFGAALDTLKDSGIPFSAK